MAERSRAPDAAAKPPRPEFSRGRLVVGLILVTLLAAGVAFAMSRFRSGPEPGRLFYAGPQGVYEHDLESGDDERVAEIDDLDVATVSPDARWVAYLSRGRLVITNLEEDEDLELEVADRLVAPLGWAPDGRLVAGELLSDGDIVAVNPEGSREILFSGSARGAVPVWLDDERFAIARTAKEFVIVQNREPVAATRGAPLAASADGKELLLQRGKDIVVATVDGASVVNDRKIFGGRAERAATSRTGLVAITGEDDRGRDGVWVFEGGTDVRRVYTKTADWLGWSAESSHLLYARKGAVYGVRLPDGRPQRLSDEDVDVFRLFSFTIVP